jgi:hypothetical protein
MAKIRNYTMKSSDRRCAAGAASLDLLRKSAGAEIHG